MPGSLVSVTVRARASAGAERTFAITVPVDLTRIFTGYGPLPAVTEVADQTGPWDHAGATRRPRFSDGGEAREKLTHHSPPGFFAYELSGFTNALGRLAAGATGEWVFTEQDGGRSTEIRWTYSFEPRGVLQGIPLRLAVAPLWRRYMARALAATVREVERPSG